MTDLAFHTCMLQQYHTILKCDIVLCDRSVNVFLLSVTFKDRPIALMLLHRGSCMTGFGWQELMCCPYKVLVISTSLQAIPSSNSFSSYLVLVEFKFSDLSSQCHEYVHFNFKLEKFAELKFYETTTKLSCYIVCYNCTSLLNGLSYTCNTRPLSIFENIECLAEVW